MSIYYSKKFNKNVFKKYLNTVESTVTRSNWFLNMDLLYNIIYIGKRASKNVCYICVPSTIFYSRLNFHPYFQEKSRLNWQLPASAIACSTNIFFSRCNYFGRTNNDKSKWMGNCAFCCFRKIYFRMDRIGLGFGFTLPRQCRRDYTG